jgi:SET domain-containing protein
MSVPYIAIAAYGSLCNHSCDPNVEARVIATTRHIDWVAVRDIAEGEELTNRYATIKNPEKRKAYLKEEYGFECKCPLCLANAELPSANPTSVKKKKKKTMKSSK